MLPSIIEWPFLTSAYGNFITDHHFKITGKKGKEKPQIKSKDISISFNEPNNFWK